MVTADTAGTMEIRGALARLRRATGLPVVFGGLVDPGRRQMRITELSGNATVALRSLAVTSGSGLGGKAVALARPCAVTDYSVSRQISHEYDAAVAEEGLRSVLAVPVVVRRRVRGVLYGALRTAQPLGDRTLSAAVTVARDVEQALVVREEAGGLLAAARAEPAAPGRVGRLGAGAGGARGAAGAGAEDHRPGVAGGAARGVRAARAGRRRTRGESRAARAGCAGVRGGRGDERGDRAAAGAAPGDGEVVSALGDAPAGRAHAGRGGGGGTAGGAAAVSGAAARRAGLPA
ncbi:hypothetical protein GCM10020256_13230 [Streptomyces thermocoprophilus]